MEDNIKKELDQIGNIVDQKIEKAFNQAKDNAKGEMESSLKSEIDNLTTYDLYQMGTTGDYTPDEMANININYSELPSAPSATENVLQTETFNRLLKTAVVKDYNRVFKVVDNFDGTAEEALAAGVIDQQDFNLLDLGNRVVISEDTEDKILTGYTTGQLTDLYGTQAMMQIAELYPNWESNNELKALAPNQFESTGVAMAVKSRKCHGHTSISVPAPRNR